MDENLNIASPEDCPFGFLRARFDTKYWSKHFDMDLFRYAGPTISHYTDLHGLYGIIESGGFWLSDHRFLNDSEEFENGRRLTIALLNGISQKSRYKHFRSIVEGSLSFLEGYMEEPYYLCSFSRDYDSLDQWRSYAYDGQGVSINFYNQQNGLGHFFMAPILSAKKVVYNDAEKTRVILRTLRKYSFEYFRDISCGFPIDDGTWSSEMATWLAMEFITFKHPSYQSEQEVRLIAASSHLQHFGGIRHRVGKQRIIPYISTKDLYNDHLHHLIGSSLPIKEIRVGPAANQATTIRSIEEYLKNMGYTSVDVIKSTVPYRG